MIKRLQRQKKYLLAAVVAVLVVVVGVVYYIVWVRPAREEVKVVGYPPRLQELVQKAEAKINQSPNGNRWSTIFYNDYVNIVYSQQYKDNIKSKPRQVFVVLNKKPKEEVKVKKIVTDFFEGLGVKDLSTLNIVWTFRPEFSVK